MGRVNETVGWESPWTQREATFNNEAIPYPTGMELPPTDSEAGLLRERGFKPELGERGRLIGWSKRHGEIEHDLFKGTDGQWAHESYPWRSGAGLETEDSNWCRHSNLNNAIDCADGNASKDKGKAQPLQLLNSVKSSWDDQGEPSDSDIDDMFAEHDRLADEYDDYHRQYGVLHPDDLSSLPAGETITKRYDRTPEGLVEHHWEDDLLPPYEGATDSADDHADMSINLDPESAEALKDVHRNMAERARQEQIFQETGDDYEERNRRLDDLVNESDDDNPRYEYGDDHYYDENLRSPEDHWTNHLFPKKTYDKKFALPPEVLDIARGDARSPHGYYPELTKRFVPPREKLRRENAKKIAMPRDDGFLRGLRYEVSSDVEPSHPATGFHKIKAFHPDGSDAGYMEWDAFDGRILDIGVTGESRRKGLGTELYNRAYHHSISNGFEPPEHDWDSLSDDAKDWIAGMGQAPDEDDPVHEEFHRGWSRRARLGAVTPDESGIKAAGIAVIALDTGRVLMQQRALNPLMCPCGQGVTWDGQNGYQHDDGSVSHDDTDESVSDLLEGAGEEDPNEGTWEMPGGCLEDGESPRQAAVREFREEVGQDLPPGVFVGAWVSPGGLVVQAAQLPEDALHRRTIKNNPRVIVPGIENYVSYGGKRYLRKLPRGGGNGGDGIKDEADREYFGSLLMRAVGANAGHVVRSSRKDDPPHTVYSEVKPGLLVAPWFDNRSATHTKPGVLIGLGDVLSGQMDREGNNWGQLPNGEPFAYDFEYSFPESVEGNDRWNADRAHMFATVPERTDSPTAEDNRWGTVGSDFDHNFVKPHGLFGRGELKDNLLSPGSDVPRITQALQSLRPEYERAGRSDWHDELMDRWNEIKQHATGDDSDPVLAGKVLPHEARAGQRIASSSVDWSAENEEPVFESEPSMWRRHSVDPGVYVSRATPDRSFAHPNGDGSWSLRTLDGSGDHGVSTRRYESAQALHDSVRRSVGLPPHTADYQAAPPQRDLDWLHRTGVKLGWKQDPLFGPTSLFYTRDMPDGSTHYMSWSPYGNSWDGGIWDQNGFTRLGPEFSKGKGIPFASASGAHVGLNHLHQNYFRSPEEQQIRQQADRPEQYHVPGEGVGNTQRSYDPIKAYDYIPPPWWEWESDKDDLASKKPPTGYGDFDPKDWKGSPMQRLNAAKTPVYKGFIYLIQYERDLDLTSRDHTNPDDPDGDFSEQTAWWDIEHAKKNPALRPEVKKGTPWDELELWADKSVRANKEVKEAFARLSAVRVNDLESDRRHVRTNPKEDPQRQRSNNVPTIWTIGGHRYLEKRLSKEGAGNEFLSSLVGRALGADVSPVMLSPRSDNTYRISSAILTRIQPGYKDHYTMPLADQSWYHSNLLRSSRGVRLGLFDSLVNVTDHGVINYGTKPDPNERGGVAPHSIDYEHSMENFHSDPWSSSSPHALRFIDDTHYPQRLKVSNPLTQRDVVRGRSALANLRPVFQSLGRESDHDNLLSRWDKLSRGASGKEGQDVLPERLPDISLLAREARPNSLMKHLPNGDVLHAYDSGGGRWVNRTFSQDSAPEPIGLARAHESALKEGASWQDLGYQPGYPRHMMGNPPERQPRISKIEEQVKADPFEKARTGDESGLPTTEDRVRRGDPGAGEPWWVYEHGPVKESATQRPTNRDFESIKAVLTAGRPEYSIRPAGQVPFQQHDMIVDSPRPKYHEEPTLDDPAASKIYAIRNPAVKAHTFLAPVRHDETGESGWLRGGTNQDPSRWLFYPDEELDRAVAGQVPSNMAGDPEDRRVVRQRVVPPGEWQEGDVELHRGFQVVDPEEYRKNHPRYERWDRFPIHLRDFKVLSTTSGNDDQQPWWIVS